MVDCDLVCGDVDVVVVSVALTVEVDVVVVTARVEAASDFVVVTGVGAINGSVVVITGVVETVVGAVVVNNDLLVQSVANFCRLILKSSKILLMLILSCVEILEKCAV